MKCQNSEFLLVASVKQIYTDCNAPLTQTIASDCSLIFCLFFPLLLYNRLIVIIYLQILIIYLAWYCCRFAESGLFRMNIITWIQDSRIPSVVTLSTRNPVVLWNAVSVIEFLMQRLYALSIWKLPLQIRVRKL